MTRSRSSQVKLVLGLMILVTVGGAFLYALFQGRSEKLSDSEPDGRYSTGEKVSNTAGGGAEGAEAIDNIPVDPVPLLADYYDALLGYNAACFSENGFPQWRVGGNRWRLPLFTEWGVGPTSPEEARRLGMLGPDLELYPTSVVVMSGGGDDPQFNRVFDLCTVVQVEQADTVEGLEARVVELQQEAAAAVRTKLSDRVGDLVGCALADFGQPGEAEAFMELMAWGRGPHIYPGLPDALQSVGIRTDIDSLHYRWPWRTGAFAPEGPVVAREVATMFPRPGEAEVKLATAWARCRETSLPQPELESILRETWDAELSRQWDELAPMVAGVRSAMAEIPAGPSRGDDLGR